MTLSQDPESNPLPPVGIASKRGGRPLRFAIAGAINTAFGLAIYPLLLYTVPFFRTHYLIALAIAQGTSLAFAFTTYKLGVFKTRKNIVREFSTFSQFYLINYIVNWLALPLLVEAFHVRPVIGQLGFSAILMIGSYFWHSRLTFKPAKNPS
jgi:putative flippase GtrA